MRHSFLPSYHDLKHYLLKFFHWKGCDLTDTDTDTEEEPSYSTAKEEQPIAIKEQNEMSSSEGFGSDIMPINELTHNREFGLDKPMPFDGNWKKVENFIQECRAYLQINQRIYTTDESKVAFLMSLMKEKEALKWKQTYMRSITDEEGEINYPPVKDFVQLLLNYFQPINQERDAEHQLSQLKQGKKTAKEVITQFWLLTAQAGYTAESRSDHMHLIEKLQKVLNTSLVMKIMLLENSPTTIEERSKKQF